MYEHWTFCFVIFLGKKTQRPFTTKYFRLFWAYADIAQSVVHRLGKININEKKIYIGKRTNRRWTIQEKNEIVLLYLDQHMSATQIIKGFNIPHNKMLYAWVEQYRKFGTCVDNRGKCTKQQNPKKSSSVDNVSIESFFSILKSECLYLKHNLQKYEIP